MSYDVWAWLGESFLFRSIGGDSFILYKSYGLNQVCWSLSIEMQFYLMMGVLLLFGRWYKTGMLLLFVVGMMGVQPEGWFGQSTACIEQADWLTTGTFLPYWGMFFMGAVCFELIEHQRALIEGGNQRLKWGLSLGVFVAAICGTLWATKMHLTTVSAGITSIFFLAANGVTVRTGGVGRAVKKVLLKLGGMSYAIYLMHMVVLGGAIKVAGLVFDERGYPLFLLTAGIGLVVCCGLYYVCEKPFAKMASGWNRKQKLSVSDTDTAKPIVKIGEVERMAA